mmetsp:Transcript_3509/g.8941  ORF Transcript_3509/g.8941 Transcript_3509/m.8941 type:complete len:394 (+) Transcript_3509:359-1540(+)
MAANFHSKVSASSVVLSLNKELSRAPSLPGASIWTNLSPRRITLHVFGTRRMLRITLVVPPVEVSCRWTTLTDGVCFSSPPFVSPSKMGGLVLRMRTGPMPASFCISFRVASLDFSGEFSSVFSGDPSVSFFFASSILPEDDGTDGTSPFNALPTSSAADGSSSGTILNSLARTVHTQSSSCSPLAVLTTEEVGNVDGLALEDLLGLWAKVPAKPLLLLVTEAPLGEGAGLPFDAEPNPKEVPLDLRDPKPVCTALNPPPNPLDSPFSTEDDDFNAPNPLETAPNPEPNPPGLAVSAPPDPNVGTLAPDPKTAGGTLAPFSEFSFATGARFTEANAPPPTVPPFPPLDHLLLALTIFRFLITSSGARLKASLRFPPSSFRSSSSSDSHGCPSG